MPKVQEEPSSRPIRVAIVEDDRATREGLGILIGGTPGYCCVGTFRSVEDALRSHGDDPPDVVLLDIHLPGMLGSEGVRALKEKHPSAEVVMLTVYADDEKVFESICNGACGYLLKETPPAKLLESIREAHRGGAPMSPEVTRKVVSLFQKTGPPAKLEAQLSPQEVRLRDYIRSSYEKLHVHSRSEAVSKALRNRIIS